MKTEFEHNGEIIAIANLEKMLYVDDTITIFGKEYVVFENYHEVEIDENDVHEKVVCTVVTEKEKIDWDNQPEYNKIYEGIVHETR